MKIPNKRELQQAVSNHIEVKVFIKLYKDYTIKRYSFLVNDITLPNSIKI